MLFPKVKFAIIYCGQDEILGTYRKASQTVYINPFRDDVTYLKFFITWIHEFVHHLLRKTPPLDEVFEMIHYRFHIL